MCLGAIWRTPLGTEISRCIENILRLSMLWSGCFFFLTHFPFPFSILLKNLKGLIELISEKDRDLKLSRSYTAISLTHDYFNFRMILVKSNRWSLFETNIQLCLYLCWNLVNRFLNESVANGARLHWWFCWVKSTSIISH